MACATSKDRPACALAQSDQSLCFSLDYSMTVKLLAEQHLEFLTVSFTGGCTTLGRWQSKMSILLTDVDQKSIETEFLIAICRLTGDKWQSKTLFLAVFDSVRWLWRAFSISPYLVCAQACSCQNDTLLEILCRG